VSTIRDWNGYIGLGIVNRPVGCGRILNEAGCVFLIELNSIIHSKLRDATN